VTAAGASPFEVLAEVRRGRVAESWHLGAIAVVAPEGELVAFCGDPSVRTYVRSAAKPVQAIPLLVGGGAERFSLTPSDIALMCASHSGNPEHTARAADLLERVGLDESALRCGSHPPMNVAAADALKAGGVEPTPLHNNCSGKHAGMLLACELLGFDKASYDAVDHPLQERILVEIERFFDVGRGEMEIGIDGCSLPTFRAPLRALARAYSRLADPRRSGLAGELAERTDQVYDAMTGEPGMVAGEERFTTRLMQVTEGRVLGKEGAEGVYAMAVRDPLPLGIAVKIADGGERSRDAVVVALVGARHSPL